MERGMGIDERGRWVEMVLRFVVYFERREQWLCPSHDVLVLV